MKCPISVNDENPDGSVKVNIAGRWAVWRGGGCDAGKPGGCGGLSQKEVFQTMARVRMYREECGFQCVSSLAYSSVSFGGRVGISRVYCPILLTPWCATFNLFWAMMSAVSC